MALGLTLHDAVGMSAIVAVQSISGAMVWRWARGPQPAPMLELLGMGIAIGTILAMLAGVLLNLLLPWPGWWIAPTVVIAGVAVVRRRGWSRRAPVPNPGGSTFGAWVLGSVLGIAALALNLGRYPLSWTGVWNEYHPDIVFFEALGTGVARFGSADSIFMTGAPIRYHWFAYAWAGQVGLAADAAPFAALTRVLPVVALVGTMALAVSWAKRLTAVRWVPYVAAVLVGFGGYVGATNGTILNFDSPSQALSTLWLLAFVTAVLAATERLSPVLIGLTMLLAVAMTGSKVSTAVTALGGVGCLAVVSMLQRREDRVRTFLLLASALLASTVTFLVVLAGNASSGDLQFLSLDSRAAFLQGLNSSVLPRGLVFGTAALALAICARWAGVYWLLRDRAWRWRPDLVISVGMGLIGMLALALFSQGVNETWFALAASAPMAVMSAVGLGVAWQSIPARRWPVGAAALGVLLTPFIAIIWAHGWPGMYVIRFWAPLAAYAVAALSGVVAFILARNSRGRIAVAVVLTVLVAASASGRLLPLAGSAWRDLVGVESRSGAVSNAAVAQAQESPTALNQDFPSALIEQTGTSTPSPRTSPAPDGGGWSDRERDAAGWLRAHASIDDVIVTDDVDSFLVPALTGLRTYISGAPYQALYGSRSTVSEIPERVRHSLAFSREPSAAAAVELCAQGVRWAWLRNAPAVAVAPDVGTIAFGNDRVTIVKLADPACPH